MKKDFINVFVDWALLDRDMRMAEVHVNSDNAIFVLTITSQEEFSLLM